MEMLMTANSEWHNLGLRFSIHLILESQCQLHLRTEQQIYHLSSLALQTTGKEDESTLREDVDEEFCLVW